MLRFATDALPDDERFKGNNALPLNYANWSVLEASTARPYGAEITFRGSSERGHFFFFLTKKFKLIAM